jgi:hypothetical protein
MHNCSETRERLTELLLDGADCRSDEVLSAELRGCTDCRNEFEVINATLRITTRSRELSAPADDYWTTYHAKLRHKLLNVNSVSKPSLLERFFRFSIPVPAPVALVLLIALALLVPLGIKAARTQTAQSPSVVHVPVEVQVPVVQEKIVTRVVYRERRPRARSSNAEPKVESTFAKFKPTDEVKLTVIKGGSPYEK